MTLDMADVVRTVFRGHPAAVSLVTADAGGRPAALTVTSMISVSVAPPMVCFSLSSESSSAPDILAAETVVAHLLGAEETWLARIAGRTPDVAVWPELDVVGCLALMERNHRAFAALAAAGEGELSRMVEYRTSQGVAFTNNVAEILHHAAMHGMYHRGQVALEVRRLGGTPRATDLIVYLREAQVG